MGISHNELQSQHHAVHQVKAEGDIDIKFLLKDQGWYVHAARGRPCPHDDTDAAAYKDTCVDYRHHLFLKHKPAKARAFQKPQHHRVDNGADHRGDCKLFSQDPRPQDEHGNIENADKKADWYSHGVGGKQGQSRGSSCYQPIWHDEHYHCQGIHGVAKDNLSDSYEFPCYLVFLFHVFSPFSL
jgi:hypothetical protein